jgi:spore coat polysaccharide biosynthesis protein SpsF (cytidylyltransferase family)
MPGDPSSRRGSADPTPDAMATRMGDQQARSRNADRQNRLEVDTKKLLTLATELKEQVEKTDKNVLSIDVIKKADEIERLAKSVKERMKG